MESTRALSIGGHENVLIWSEMPDMGSRSLNKRASTYEDTVALQK